MCVSNECYYNMFQYVSCHSAYRVCSNERVIGCIGCDSWLPRASSFHRGWLKFASVKCGRHWQWRLFGSLVKMVKSEVDSWSNRRNLWQDANGDPDMGDDHEKQMPGPSRVWFDEHWTQNTSSTRRTRQRHVFAGMFEARRAEARWRAGAIHVVLPDPNNGNTDMNIPLKLKRHQQNNLWVKHVYLLFVAGLLTSITSIFCWNWCWRMQNDAKHSCRNISDIDRLRTAPLCGERL